MKKKLIIFLTIGLSILSTSLALVFQGSPYNRSKDVSTSNYSNERLCPAIRNSYNIVLICQDELIELKTGVVIHFKESSKANYVKADVDDLKSIFFPQYHYYDQQVSDGGRNRIYPLLQAQYGKDEKAISKNLVKVKFLGTNVLFNKQNGAAKALERVSLELEKIINDENRPYVSYPQTYNYRKIYGEEELSTHSFGIAIDLNPRLNNGYWHWDRKHRKVPKLSDMPENIIKVFERNGFIWGGRWIHYDSMHFEYRPEFFAFKKLSESKY